MVFSSPDFSASITPQPLSDLMLSAKVYLNTSFCLVLHDTLWPVHWISHQINLIFTTPYVLQAGASKPIHSRHLVFPPRLHSLQSHPISNTSQPAHVQLMFLPYTVSECRSIIRNQPVSTTIPSPSSFHDITTIRKHQYFGEILKYFFLMFFKTVSHIAKHSTGPVPTLVFIRTQKN